MPEVQTGVAVIVIKEDKVLVGERQGSHGAGILAFPGGSFDDTDTSIFNCGVREVLEETGITCQPFSIDGYRDDLFSTFDILSEDGKKRYVTCYIVADYVSGGEHYIENCVNCVKPLEPNKCEKWEWLTIQELNERVTDKVWIPIDKINHYLPDLSSRFFRYL